MALTGNSIEEKIYNFLYGRIKNAFGVSGLMGNLYAESGLVPTNLQNSFEKKLGLQTTHTQLPLTMEIIQISYMTVPVMDWHSGLTGAGKKTCSFLYAPEISLSEIWNHSLNFCIRN